MVYTVEEPDVLQEEVPRESKTTDSLKEHRKQIKRRKQKKEEQPPSLVRDVVGWIAIVGAIAWLLMLISFDPTDPSPLHQTSKMIPDNYLGRVGAGIAAYSFEFFGFGNYALPLCAIYLGFLCIRTRPVNDWFFRIMGGGTVVFVFLIFLGSFRSVVFKGEDIMPGGLVGMAMWRFFSGYLNPFGTYLMLFAVSGLAVLVTTQLTLSQIGRWLMQGLNWVWLQLRTFAETMRGKIEERSEKRTRHKIARRELDRMEEEREKRERIVRRLHGMDEDEEEPEAEVPAVTENPEQLPGDPIIISAELDNQETPEPAVQAPTPQPEGKGGEIKVNPLKPLNHSTQGSFQFVQELESTWVYPSSFDHFKKASLEHKIDEDELIAKANSLRDKFAEFNVTGDMREIHPGPVVTTYEFKPDAGIKYSKVVNLADDLCLALGAESIRIDRMMGRSSIGIEVPNNKRELITFREMVETQEFQDSKAKLILCLGKTIDGTPFSANLAKMPHLLIAGQTGSGKSVGINAMLCSILMRNSPEETKLIMIDPKMVELGIYADIPHLLTPVVTDPLKAANALKWAVDEMERRYRLLAENAFRNLDHYNDAARKQNPEETPPEERLEVLPYIVVVIDEMADLMMVARGEVEESIARLAQKSRAIGIHLILATQRPSVDIITGVIKSNLPSRLAYRVAQRNDSRIILDGNGAEQLLGKGDALFLGPGTSRLVRVHAPFLSETEVLSLVKSLKNQGAPSYNEEVVKKYEPAADDVESDMSDSKGKGKKAKKKASTDEMYEKAARLVVRSGQASVSYLQRKLGLGYARAAKLVDLMEDDGIVGPSQGSKARDILVSADFFDEIDNARME